MSDYFDNHQSLVHACEANRTWRGYENSTRLVVLRDDGSRAANTQQSFIRPAKTAKVMHASSSDAQEISTAMKSRPG
jgi:hypothetical protein